MSHQHDAQEALDYRYRHRGLIGVESKVPVKDRSTLSLVYTPGVAEPCLAIHQDPQASFEYTCRGNTVALITDGSALFGMGAAGPLAALPAMEGKSVIFKTFAGIDALPMCLEARTLDELIQNVTMLAPTFGAFCLEDIASPNCFSLEDRLQRAVNVPIFHNHAHGAGVMVLAGLYNALPLLGKRLEDARIVVLGAGSAGIGTARLLTAAGARNVIVCDRAGAIHKYRPTNMNWVKAEIARQTNPQDFSGPPAEALRGADVLIGLSAANAVTPEFVSRMAQDAVVFALAVPTPEIMPAEAKRAGATIVATGRSDLPNQLDIALVFPGVLRGLLDVQARNVTPAILLAAAKALAECVPADEVGPERIIPPIFDFRVAPALAAAVAKVAMATGEARKTMETADIVDRLRRFTYEGSFPVEPRAPGKPLTQKEEAMELHRRFRGKLQVVSKVPIRDTNILGLLYLPPGLDPPGRGYSERSGQGLRPHRQGEFGGGGLGRERGPRPGQYRSPGRNARHGRQGGALQDLWRRRGLPNLRRHAGPDEIVAVVRAIAPVFGGINLEDISAPRCFAVEDRLKKELDIPVFHDDQHGTAVIVLAALLNGLKITGRTLPEPGGPERGRVRFHRRRPSLPEGGRQGSHPLRH